MSIVLPTPRLVDLNPAAANYTIPYNSVYVYSGSITLLDPKDLRQPLILVHGRVVAVPDIGKPHNVQAWTNGASNWLTTVLPKLITRPRILEFQYVDVRGDSFSWELLLHCGDALLQELLSKAEDPQVLQPKVQFLVPFC